MDQHLDQSLILVAISAYIIGDARAARVLPVRAQMLRSDRHSVCVPGLRRAVRRAGRALPDDPRLAADEPLRLALALRAMSVAIFIVFALKYDLWFVGGFVLALAAIALGYATTWNEGYLPAGAGAAVVLDQDPRSARRLVVRGVHGRVCVSRHVPVEIFGGAPLRSGAARAARRRGGAGRRASTSLSRVRRRRRVARATRAHRDAGDHRRRRPRATRSRSGWPRCRRSRSSTS